MKILIKTILQVELINNKINQTKSNNNNIKEII